MAGTGHTKYAPLAISTSLSFGKALHKANNKTLHIQTLFSSNSKFFSNYLRSLLYPESNIRSIKLIDRLVPHPSELIFSYQFHYLYLTP